ncbi:MAG: hypothetical protein TRG1_2949 [Flavobacteriaceae bacterium FS1-H7996/R]|nr:MAG: hypothetical protein TRG1_2949 [Flavobacteriaceae bacterium FS1-H7996/R]
MRFAFFESFAAFFSFGVKRGSFLTVFLASCDFAIVSHF